MLVAIPAAGGPLPMKEPLDKSVRALIREAECREEVERVPLLGRASSIPSPHPGPPDSAVRFRLGLRIEFLVVDVAQPAVEDLVSQGEQRPIGTGVSDVREGRQDPMSSLPLRIRVPDRSEAAAQIPMGQEGSHARRATNLPSQVSNPF